MGYCVALGVGCRAGRAGAVAGVGSGVSFIGGAAGGIEAWGSLVACWVTLALAGAEGCAEDFLVGVVALGFEGRTTSTGTGGFEAGFLAGSGIGDCNGDHQGRGISWYNLFSPKFWNYSKFFHNISNIFQKYF